MIVLTGTEFFEAIGRLARVRFRSVVDFSVFFFFRGCCTADLRDNWWLGGCLRIRRELEIVAVLFYWQGLLSRSNFILFEKFCCHYFREFFRIWYFDTFIPLITLCTAVQQYWLVSKIRFSKILQRPFFEITIKRHYFAEQRHSLRYSRRSHDFPL